MILFKAQRTIAQSQKNKANFHKLIDGLTAGRIASIRKSNISLVQRAFRFFDNNNISNEQLAERLKREFQEDYCLSVNEEKEKENYQILVNTLEDRNNRIRAIFAVQKLNEGWDVLNLFDIVRCYEARDTGKWNIGATTMSEAQLIGRGARYFPCAFRETDDDRFRRKFDGDLENELRVLEELHYHSINDSRYISEIRTALIEQGMMDEREVTRELKLKEPFKQTDFYKYGVVWRNDRRLKTYQYVQSFADLGVKRRNYVQCYRHRSWRHTSGFGKRASGRHGARRKPSGPEGWRHRAQHCSICHCTQSILYFCLTQTLFPQPELYARLHR